MTMLKLIFGVVVPTSATFVVTGGPATAMPDLVATPRPAGGVTPPPVNGAYNTATKEWTLTLAAGDYIVRLDLATWFAGTLPITASSPADFVYFTAGASVAWTDTVAIGRGDPKDPWPPPNLQKLAQLPQASQTWFDTNLGLVAAGLPKAATLWFDEAPPAAL